MLDYTGADAIMIGRAAMGRPWLFREIEHYLATGEHLAAPEVTEIHRIMLEHLDDLYRFYGEYTGVRMARKHIAWYTKGLADSASFRHAMNQLENSQRILHPGGPAWPPADLRGGHAVGTPGRLSRPKSKNSKGKH